MPNYSNGKIYRIFCNKTGLQYYGSTTQSLAKRMGHHKTQYIRNGNISSKLILENGDYEIVLVEDYPCERKEQLHQRERFYIETMECVNKQIPTRTDKQYREDNKEYNKIRNKQYREENKDKIKEWVEENKEKLKLYRKAYYEKNKKFKKQN
jgi:hypothetical protein